VRAKITSAQWVLSIAAGALTVAVLTGLAVRSPMTPRAAASGNAAVAASPELSVAPALSASPTSTAPAPASAPAPARRPVVSAVNLKASGSWSWALRNTNTGEVIGSEDKASFTNNTESMIKVWIATDYLMDVEASGRQVTAAEQERLRKMIHFSDDQAAQWAYASRGSDLVVKRLISTCKLTDTKVTPNWWSKTQISARDAALMGDCVLNGKLLSPRWHDWLLGQMRSVDPSNAFGVAEAPALAGKEVAIKNGWTEHTTAAGSVWAVNCLAVWGGWSLAVLTNYPAKLGQSHGADICREVAQQLFANDS
jgi:hypothetical protein